MQKKGKQHLSGGGKSKYPKASNDSVEQNGEGRLIRQMFSGPMPPPEMMERYEQIYPGFVANLLEQQKSESSHRQEMEKKRDRSVLRMSFIGTIAGIVVMFGVLALSAYAIHKGQAEAIKYIIGAPVVSIISIFATKKVAQHFQSKNTE